MAAEKDISLTYKDGKLGALRQSVHEVETELMTLSETLHREIDSAVGITKWTLYSSMLAIVVAVAGLLSWSGYRISRRARRAAFSMHQVAAGDGDLTRRLDEEGSDEFAELGHSFNLFASKIHDLLKRVAELTTTLSQTSSKVTDAAYATNSSMLKLRNNTHTVVTATEEMSATAREVAGNVHRVSDSSKGADQLSAEGRQTVEKSIVAINSFAEEFNEAAGTISSLKGETENIGSILDVIRGISEQTNLLALNAAIEVARADEQGRGFAVVADEVRSLAHRSHESTSEIQELIERLQNQAESAVVKIQGGNERIQDTVSQARQAGVALERITKSVCSNTDMTTHIATATEEQSIAVDDISSSVTAIDSLALDTASSAQGTTALTADLERAMSAVTQELRQFRFQNNEQLVLSQARTAHLNWKGRLHAFLDGDSLFSSDQVASHHHCDLGKWYYNEGTDRFGDRVEFKAVENPHERIHKAIRQVVKLREKGDTEGAETAYTNVEKLSGEVVECLDKLVSSLRK